MNIFDTNIETDFNYMLSTMGKNIKINGTENIVLLSLSNNTIRSDFEIRQGDLIEHQNSKYLIIDEVVKYKNSYKGTIRKCPYTIKISFDGVTNKEFVCFADSKIFDITTGQFFNSVNGEIYVTLQNNLDSNSINLNTRFIKLGYPWKVMGIDRTKENLITLTAKIDTKTDTDDMVHESTIIIHEYSMSVTNKVNSINVNATYNLILDCKVDGAIDSNPVITYTSSDETIATINSAGQITGVADGNCVISATYHDITDTINLAVKTVHNILITNETSNIKGGNTYKLTLDCKTNGIVDASPVVTYSSSDESVASIDSAGQITGISEGNVTITATYFDSVATMELSVQAIAYAISITNKVSSLNVGDTLQLITTCTQDGITDSSSIINWSSSDSNVINVDNNGLVTAISSGTAMITATYNNTIDIMEVTVAEVANFTYDLTSSNNLLIIKKTTTITYTGHKYNNGVEVAALFDFTIDYGTLATSAITITATTDTYIKIKGNADTGTFILRCTERGTTNYVEKTIQLKNIYGN